MPALRPRRLSLDSMVMMARQIGITPPSSRPMIRRAPISIGKLVERPVITEQTEKPITHMIRTGFRLPVRSETNPTR